MSVIVICASDLGVIITRDNCVICDTKCEKEGNITRDISVIRDINSPK